MKRMLVWLLLTGMLAVSVFGCSTETARPSGSADSDEATVKAEAAPSAELVPDRGVPDKAGLAYPDVMEPYRKSDWQANWIWIKGPHEDCYAAFRKTFTANAAQDATMYISSVDKYVLWINGTLLQLDGCLKRGPSPYDSYYDTLTVPLQAGENTIAVLVAFNGRDGDGSLVPILIDEEGDPVVQGGLLCELHYDDTVLCSGSDWKVVKLDAYKNRRTAGKAFPAYPQASQLAERNVYYDARDSIGDWTAPAYDDSAWNSPVLIAKAGDLPFGGLYAAIIQPIRFYETVSFPEAEAYCGKPLSESTTIELPLPKNTQFTFSFSLDAPAGKIVTVYTDTYQFDGGLCSFKDNYVTAEGAQTYENYPWRSGTKLIIEAEGGITFTDIGYRISEFNGTRMPAFTSSDAELDQLWLEGQNTITICMRDTFMDCPERERGPYMGDGSNEADATLYGYDIEGLNMIRKAILASVAWTKADGGIPSRAPSVKPQEIPNQSLAFLSAAYHYWLHSGDVETMTAYYRASVDYLQKFNVQDGILEYRSGTWTWDDWGKNIDKELLQTGFYFYAMRLTDALGNELGIETEAEAAFFAERMTAMRNAYESAYYTPEGFKSSNVSFIDERANGLLALSGLADPQYYDLIANVIATTQEASPFCEKYILEALCVMGREDLMIERMKQRYDLMLHDAYDTLWEQYWPNDGTINHGWTAAPTYILPKYIAGVQPTSGGFATYTISPSDTLDRYSCTVWTPKGNIRVARDGALITIEAVEGGTLLWKGVETPLEIGEHTYSLTGGNPA